jgi:CHAT domain
MILLMTVDLHTQAQTTDDLHRWDSMIVRYDASINQKEYNKAFSIADSACTEIIAYKRTASDRLLAGWLARRGRTYLALQDYKSSKSDLESALTYYDQSIVWEDQHTKGAIYQNLASSNRALGELSLSVEQNKRAIQILDTLTSVKSQMALAKSYGTLLRSLSNLPNRHQEVLQYYQEGIQRIEKMSWNTNVAQGVMTQNLGVSYVNTGAISAARDDFELALKYYETSGVLSDYYEDKYGILYTFGALSFYCGDLEAAIDKSKEAIEFLVDLGVPHNNPALLPAYGNLVQSYIFNEDIVLSRQIIDLTEPIIEDSSNVLEYGVKVQFYQNKGNVILAEKTADGPAVARVCYEKGLREAQKVKNVNTDTYSLLLLYHTARSYYLESRYNEAIKNLEAANTYISANPNPYYAELFRIKAECQYKLNQFEEAEITLRNAARFLSDTMVQENRIFENQIWSAIFASAAELKFEQYRKTNELHYLESSLTFLELANSWLHRSLENRSTYNGNTRLNIQLFGQLAQNILYIKSQQKNDNQQATYRKMFEWLDQCKAREMYEHYAAMHNYRSEKAPELAKMIRDLFYDIAFAKSDAVVLTSEEKIALYARQLEFDSLLNVMKDIDPGFLFGKRLLPACDILSIQEVLQDDESLVTYTLSDSLLTIFVINKDQMYAPVIQKVGIDFHKNLDRTLRILNRTPQLAPRYGDTPQDLRDTTVHFAEYAYGLDNYLLKPIEKYLKKRLIIVPDGNLHQLPFQVLLSRPMLITDHFGTLSYRSKQYAMSYCHSAALLVQLRQKRPNTPKKEVLGILPIQADEDVYGYDKISIGKDLKKIISSTFPQSTFLEMQDANLSRIKQEITDYSYVFILTHGRSDAEYQVNKPTQTFILLKTDQNKVDTVDVADLYALRSDAEFIMSTACETSKGSGQRGEGIRSVSTALITNGAKSVCSPFNEINQDFALFMSEGIINKIKMGKPRDIALQETQLEYLNMVTLRGEKFLCQPSNWGTLILSGTSH